MCQMLKLNGLLQAHQSDKALVIALSYLMPLPPKNAWHQTRADFNPSFMQKKRLHLTGYEIFYTQTALSRQSVEYDASC